MKLGTWLRRRRLHKETPRGQPHAWPPGGEVDCSSHLPDDSIPVRLSPGRFTQLRPGETHAEAMNRLTKGEDL